MDVFVSVERQVNYQRYFSSIKSDFICMTRPTLQLNVTHKYFNQEFDSCMQEISAKSTPTTFILKNQQQMEYCYATLIFDVQTLLWLCWSDARSNGTTHSTFQHFIISVKTKIFHSSNRIPFLFRFPFSLVHSTSHYF